MKQYLPLKPVKRGFKVWVRGDSHNGYFCQLEVYTSRREEVLPELGLGGTVVKKLSRELVNGRYHLYFDNYFTRTTLLADLLADEIYACGTVRSTRVGFPKELADKLDKQLNLRKR